MEKQIERKACKNCIHHRMCVDKFRKSKQDGEVLLIEEEAYFADAGDCDFYADKRVYRKQSEGEWIWTENGEADYEKYWVCSVCKERDFLNTKFCSNCGAKMKGANNEHSKNSKKS